VSILVPSVTVPYSIRAAARPTTSAARSTIDQLTAERSDKPHQRLRRSLSGRPRRMMRQWENRVSAAAGTVNRARFATPPYPASGKL
jgi:hypothetical protein